MEQVSLCDNCKQALTKLVELKNGFDEHGRAFVYGRCLNDIIGECSCRSPQSEEIFTILKGSGIVLVSEWDRPFVPTECSPGLCVCGS